MSEIHSGAHDWTRLLLLAAGASLAGCGSTHHGATPAAEEAGADAGVVLDASEDGDGAPALPPGSPPIPPVTGACPTLATGNVTVMGQSVQLWVGTKQANVKGPVLFYWHGTGSTSNEASLLFANAIQDITSEGGIVASFSTSTMQGMNTGNNVWYTGDFAMADQILACAVQQLNIDTKRIYTGGCSAGGLQAGAMLFERSSYLAAVMTNSGGRVYSYQFQDSHTPPLITTHGAMGVDVVIIDFSGASAILDDDVVARGGFAVDCNHMGGHCGAPQDDLAALWQFCKDHPFGVSPEPYAHGLPASFPSYCTIITPPSDAGAEAEASPATDAATDSH